MYSHQNNSSDEKLLRYNRQNSGRDRFTTLDGSYSKTSRTPSKPPRIIRWYAQPFEKPSMSIRNRPKGWCSSTKWAMQWIVTVYTPLSVQRVWRTWWMFPKRLRSQKSQGHSDINFKSMEIQKYISLYFHRHWTDTQNGSMILHITAPQSHYRR